MLDRDYAVEKLTATGLEDSLWHHALETEAVMRGLAEKLGHDPVLWGLTGLLHDFDYPETLDDPVSHGLVAANKLEGDLPEPALHAIKAHNAERNGVEPQSDIDWALRCCESVTGLVHAAALLRPTGMEGMKPKSLKKKMKDKAFARNVSRENIQECEKLGLELSEFLQVAIEAMSGVQDQVGLAK
jgi:putative nucleotidyltransferase with HDIG domain